MKVLTIIITLLVVACTARTPDTMSDSPFGLDLKKKVTIADLWEKKKPPIRFDKLGENNIIYRCKDSSICYLLIDELYCIEIREGKLEHLEIGMKMRQILKKLGKTDIHTFPNGKKILEYNYSENINYIMTLEIKNNKLTKIYIRRKI